MRIFQVATVDGRPWLPAVMERLVAEGITRLLVEGGPRCGGRSAAAGLVDEIVEYRAPGNDGRSADIDARAARDRRARRHTFAFERRVRSGGSATDMIHVLSRKRGS